MNRTSKCDQFSTGVEYVANLVNVNMWL